MKLPEIVVGLGLIISTGTIAAEKLPEVMGWTQEVGAMSTARAALMVTMPYEIAGDPIPGPEELTTLEPELRFTDGPSTGPNVVSIKDGSSIRVAVRAENGACVKAVSHRVIDSSSTSSGRFEFESLPVGSTCVA